MSHQFVLGFFAGVLGVLFARALRSVLLPPLLLAAYRYVQPRWMRDPEFRRAFRASFVQYVVHADGFYATRFLLFPQALPVWLPREVTCWLQQELHADVLKNLRPDLAAWVVTHPMYSERYERKGTYPND